MELRVNDYVRTKKGIIGKIKLIDNQIELKNLYLVKRKWYYKKDIIKSSPNIIDLIEVGDYVNGYKVLNVLDFNDNSKMLSLEKIYDSKITNEDIKSIVTHEQMEQMEYKVED